jgi:hypothetical protein
MLRAYSFGKLFLLRFKQMSINIARTIVTLIPVKCCMQYYQQEKRIHYTMHPAACVVFLGELFLLRLKQLLTNIAWTILEQRSAE